MANSNVNALVNYAMNNGMKPIGGQEQDDKKNEWQRMLAMLAMANQMDWRTLAGFGIGRLLNQYATRQKEKVDSRGDMKTRLSMAKPDERQELLNNIQQSDTHFYNRLRKNPAYADWFSDSASQPTQPAQNEVSSSLQQYAKELDKRENPYLGEAYLGEAAEAFQPQGDTNAPNSQWLDWLRRLGR